MTNIMFLDMKGYSSLDDDEIRNLITHAFPEMQELVEKRAPDHVNTWGDAIVVTARDVREIAHVALDMRDFFYRFDWGRNGLRPLRARISLHTGAIWSGTDVFTGRGLILGHTVNLAARIEPITQPGQVWATTDFNTALTRDRQELFRSAPLGRSELPKGAGLEDLHVIYRAHEANPLDPGKEAAVAIVVKGRQVLVVHCVDGGKSIWQFPAGQVKPNADPEAVAVAEVFDETDIRCRIVGKIGQRRHPDTQVYCHYFHAVWEEGEATNKDSRENAAVEWVSPAQALARFTTDVEPAVRTLLEALDRSE